MAKNKLFELAQKRLSILEKEFKNDHSIENILEENGFSRRDFLKWSAMMSAVLALPSSFSPLVAKAAELADKIPVIWLNMSECTGCSEALIRTASPSIDTLIFDVIDLKYHETLMAASGFQAEEIIEKAIGDKQKYLLVVEGAIPDGKGEHFLTIGAHGESGKELVTKIAKNALAIFAVGSCSSFGGVQAAAPNPTNSQPLSKIVSSKVINIPGCPPSDKNIIGSFLHFIMFGTLPALDAYNRPKWAYGHRIHDLCYRRGRFDAGEFVQEFGDEYAKKGYCLYKVGCKGPYTFNSCSKDLFNQGTSWPVLAGHGCIGCSEPDFWDTMGPFVEPLGDRLYNTLFAGLGADKTADIVGVSLLALTGVAIAAHASIGMFKKSEAKK